VEENGGKESCEWEMSLQRFGREFRQIDAFLFGLSGEVLPDAPFDRGGHQDLRIWRDVVEAANSFGEVNAGRDVVVVERGVGHGPAPMHNSPFLTML